MKKPVLILLFIISVIALETCKKSKKTNEQNDSTSPFTVLTNSTDPLIFKYTKDKTSINYYGTRNNDGIPISINKLIVRQDTAVSYVTLDNIGRPLLEIAPNGVSFSYKWTDSKTANLTISVGGSKARFYVDFTNGTPVVSAINKIPKLNSKVGSVGLNSDTHLKNLDSGVPGGNNGLVQVNITGVAPCSGSDDDYVVIHAYDLAGNLLGDFPADQVSPSLYTATLPTTLGKTIQLKDICNLAGLMDKGCQFMGTPAFIGACPLLSTVLVAKIGPSLALRAAAACEVLTGIEALYCKVLGCTDNDCYGSDLCEAAGLDRALHTQEVNLYATLHDFNGNTNSNVVTAPYTGPFPPLTIKSNSGGTAIKSIEAILVSPNLVVVGGARVEICLPIGSKVTLTMINSNGSSAQSTTISTQNDQIFEVVLNTYSYSFTLKTEITLPNSNTVFTQTNFF